MWPESSGKSVANTHRKQNFWLRPCDHSQFKRSRPHCHSMHLIDVNTILSFRRFEVEILQHWGKEEKYLLTSQLFTETRTFTCSTQSFTHTRAHTFIVFGSPEAASIWNTIKTKITSLDNETIVGNYLAHKSYKIAEIEWFWQSAEQMAGVASIFPPLPHLALATSNVSKSFKPIFKFSFCKLLELSPSPVRWGLASLCQLSCMCKHLKEQHPLGTEIWSSVNISRVSCVLSGRKFTNCFSSNLAETLG